MSLSIGRDGSFGIPLTHFLDTGSGMFQKTMSEYRHPGASRTGFSLYSSFLEFHEPHIPSIAEYFINHQ
jgi:hypothetical protein